MRTRWTAADEDRLRELVEQGMPVKAIASCIPNFSYHSVRQRIYHLGLRVMEHREKDPLNRRVLFGKGVHVGRIKSELDDDVKRLLVRHAEQGGFGTIAAAINDLLKGAARGGVL